MHRRERQRRPSAPAKNRQTIDSGVLLRYRCHINPGRMYQVLLTSRAAASMDKITRKTVRQAVLGDLSVYRHPGLGLRKDGSRKDGERVGLAELETEFAVSRRRGHQLTKADVVFAIVKAAREKGPTRDSTTRRGKQTSRAQPRRGSEPVATSVSSAHRAQALHDDGLALVLASITDIKTLVACSAVCTRWREVLSWVTSLDIPRLRLYRAPRRRSDGLLKPQRQLVANKNTQACLMWIAARFSRLERLAIADLNGAKAEDLDLVCRSCTRLRALVFNQPRIEINEHDWNANEIDAIKIAQCLTALPETVGMLTQLVDLDLSNQRIRRLPVRFELVALETLDLFGNLLGQDNGAAEFDVRGCPKLRKLYIGSNDWEDFPFSVLELPALEHLNMVGCVFTVGDLELPDTLHTLTSLEVLHLNSTDIVQLPSIVPPALKDLRLRDCFQLDPSCFWSLSTVALRELHLCMCTRIGLESDGLLAICDCRTLEELQLCCCNVSVLPPEFAELQRLSWLSLAYNRLTEFPPQLRAVQSLTFLDLRGQRIDRVPEWTVELTRLEECQIPGEDLCHVPSQVNEDMPGVFRAEATT